MTFGQYHRGITPLGFAENNVGILVRITTMISRRRMHIETLNLSASEVEGINRLTVVINETEEVIAKLVQQIDKQVDVFKIFYHPREDLIMQQQVLYKAGKTVKELEALVKNEATSD